jgi:heme/copper-type cytochrome/quinol oxidase subunit 4
MVTPANRQTRTNTYVITYFAILLVAAIQFLFAHYNAGKPELWYRLLFLAIIEAFLAILFFMHLWMESRRLLFAVILIMVFVFISLQWSWPDSFRILRDSPWSTT